MTSIKITRRRMLAGAIALGMAFFGAPSSAADTIKVGAIFDLTGGLNIYGIQQSRALHLAIDDINSSGGVLGRN